MANVPQWQAEGDWFDVCKCNIPCPCEFAQPPTFGECDGILVWHVRKGSYGRVLAVAGRSPPCCSWSG